MKAFLATTCIVTGALLAGGCATKKYVRNTAAPIQAKVDQVGEQTTQNTQQITDTKNQVKDVDQRAQSGISGANEKASAADQHAGDAMNHANEAMTSATTANQKADQNAQGLSSLRQAVANTVANIDDYKQQTAVTVPFGFNKSVLTAESRQDLDKLVQDMQSDKRFFITVEGFTDRTGTAAYNETLSRKRADAVVQYLVAKHDVPIYRIHTIGLGDEKPVDEAHNREARAKNRRVEIKVFTADDVGASLGAANSANRSDAGHEK
jgi:outer membrane protein OmpA-like peptidoglycan-associated protein